MGFATADQLLLGAVRCSSIVATTLNSVWQGMISYLIFLCGIRSAGKIRKHMLLLHSRSSKLWGETECHFCCCCFCWCCIPFLDQCHCLSLLADRCAEVHHSALYHQRIVRELQNFLSSRFDKLFMYRDISMRPISTLHFVHDVTRTGGTANACTIVSKIGHK